MQIWEPDHEYITPNKSLKLIYALFGLKQDSLNEELIT